MRQKCKLHMAKSEVSHQKKSNLSLLFFVILRCFTVTTGVMTFSQGKKGTKTGKFHLLCAGCLISLLSPRIYDHMQKKI